MEREMPAINSSCCITSTVNRLTDNRLPFNRRQKSSRKQQNHGTFASVTNNCSVECAAQTQYCKLNSENRKVCRNTRHKNSGGTKLSATAFVGTRHTYNSPTHRHATRQTFFDTEFSPSASRHESACPRSATVRQRPCYLVPVAGPVRDRSAPRRVARVSPGPALA